MDYKKYTEARTALDGLVASTGFDIYKEIKTELDRLREIEDLAKNVMLTPFPTSGSSYYPVATLEQKVTERLNKTKELISKIKEQ